MTDMPDATDETAGVCRWEMFAGINDTHGNFQHVASDRRYPQAYGHEEPTAVTVTLDDDGEHLGWVSADSDEPVMIQPHPILYRMQFPHGPDAEEEGGKGRTVRLRIEAAT